MKIFNTLESWLILRKNLPRETTLGFVPTMGNLHSGHASLCARSKKEQDLTIVSIFVNPTQFNQEEDFIHYPRTLKADLELLENLGVDFCILPKKQALYSDDYRYRVTENLASMILEGQSRPGHFTGVLTIVMKLLNLVKPNTAYFGEKDYQQYTLIKDMASAFFMDLNIELCPTLREASGLAYSSRNNRLTPKQRLKAETFAKIFHQKQDIETTLKDLKAEGIEVDYIEDKGERRFIAVTIGGIRLIDNLKIKG